MAGLNLGPDASEWHLRLPLAFHFSHGDLVNPSNPTNDIHTSETNMDPAGKCLNNQVPLGSDDDDDYYYYY